MLQWGAAIMSYHWLSSKRESSQTPVATMQERVWPPSRRGDIPRLPLTISVTHIWVGEVQQNFQASQTKARNTSEGQMSCRILSGRQFWLTHPPWSPTSSQQIAEKPILDLDVWLLCPLWESLPSSQLKTVLQKNKIMIKGGSVTSHWAFSGQICRNGQNEGRQVKHWIKRHLN